MVNKKSPGFVIRYSMYRHFFSNGDLSNLFFVVINAVQYHSNVKWHRLI